MGHKVLGADMPLRDVLREFVFERATIAGREEADPKKAYFTIMDRAIAAIRKIQEICKLIDYGRMPTYLRELSWEDKC